MFFAPPYTSHERTVVAELQLLGLDGERAIHPRQEFRDKLREQLTAEAWLSGVA
jgi:hypothetical protein